MRVEKLTTTYSPELVPILSKLIDQARAEAVRTSTERRLKEKGAYTKR